MNVNRIICSTKVEGPGTRTSIWFQGCSRHCKGCFAKDTWGFEEKIKASVEELYEIVKNDVESEGITILGGEPLEQAEELLSLVQKIKKLGKTIILFTGYKYEYLLENDLFSEILKNVDVLVDGEFDEAQTDNSRPMVGSKNQRFFFITDAYTLKDFKNNSIEVRITPDGYIHINGQGFVKKISWGD